MSLALFLDVDNTLTKGLIQETFATLLDRHQVYKEIENELHQRTISPAEFGRKIIELFNKAGFTQSFALNHFSDIEIHEWTPHLFSIANVDVYLVSSGPNYYVQELAKKFGVPPSRVCCSEYTFDSNGKLKGCKAISSVSKKEFVKESRGKYNLTIGVGDNLNDGPFVTACDIAILTKPYEGFLCAESLGDVITLVSKLAKPEGSVPRTTPCLFIGSTSEGREIAEHLAPLLEKFCYPTIWSSAFETSKSYLESLEASLSEFDFAVFVATPDDVTTSRDNTRASVRDNVIFEFGLFMGRLGRERCFLLYPRNRKPKLPSDLEGVSFLDYDPNNPDLDTALTKAVNEIQQNIKRRGCRGYRL